MKTSSSQAGSALLVSMMTIAILSMVAGCILASVSSRYNTAYRSASWNDALLTAESGVDTTLSEVFRLIPDVRLGPATGLGVGYSEPSLGLVDGLQFTPAGFTTTDGRVLSVTPPALAGSGGTNQQATVSVDVVMLSTLSQGGVTGVLGSVASLLTGNDVPLLRLRSTGTVALNGNRVAGVSRLDNELWRPSLFTDRFTGRSISQATVSRQIQVLLRPVHPFEAAVVSNGPLQATDNRSVFDSFNSANGEYDSLKRLVHGDVFSNNSKVELGGKVYGDIGTNGGNVAQGSLLTGTVNNASYISLPALITPPIMSLPSFTLSGSISLAAGSPSLPTQYQFSGISGKLHITKPPLLTSASMIVYVNGDITGGIEVDSGVTAKVYVSGSIITDASQFKNNNRRAANLQIYGVPPTDGSRTQVMRLNADSELIAAIYAPAHQVTLSGNGDVSGAVVAGSFQATGAARFHYDEALALNVGPVLRYSVASWQEITN